MIKTVILTGTEQEVKFSGKFQYLHVHNLGSGEVLASLHPEVTRGKDGVKILKSGGAGYLHVDTATDTIYLAGTGEVQIEGTGNAFPPSFSGAPKGGDYITSSGSEITAGTVEYPLLALNVYGKSVQDGTPTPDAPIPIGSVGDDGAVEVTACGKNLFEGSQDFSGNWINSSAWIDSEEKYNGLAVKYRTSAWNGIGKTFNLELNVPYTASFYAKTSAGHTLQALFATNPDGVSYNTFNQNFTLTDEWTRYSVTFTCTEYSDVFLRVGAAASVDAPLYVCGYQLEKNSAMTEYEPYTGNVAEITTGLPLCSVGEYRDELIYKADGTGKIITRIRKVVFNGSEEYWKAYPTSNNKNRMGLYLGSSYMCLYGNYTTSSPSLILCDKYKSIPYLEIINGVEGIGLHHVEGQYLSIYDENFATATIDEWKAHLAANPLTVVYVLNTPREITLSATELQKLQKLQTFDSITNIYNDEGAEMTVKVATNPLLAEYVKPVIDGISARYEARIAALEAAVTNT